MVFLVVVFYASWLYVDNLEARLVDVVGKKVDVVSGSASTSYAANMDGFVAGVRSDSISVSQATRGVFLT